MDYDKVSRRLRSWMTDAGWTLDETAGPARASSATCSARRSTSWRAGGSRDGSPRARARVPPRRGAGLRARRAGRARQHHGEVRGVEPYYGEEWLCPVNIAAYVFYSPVHYHPAVVPVQVPGLFLLRGVEIRCAVAYPFFSFLNVFSLYFN